MFNRKRKENKNKTIIAEQYEIVTKLEFKVKLENERQINALKNILSGAEAYMYSRRSYSDMDYFKEELALIKEFKKVIDFT